MSQQIPSLTYMTTWKLYYPYSSGKLIVANATGLTSTCKRLAPLGLTSRVRIPDTQSLQRNPNALRSWAS